MKKIFFLLLVVSCFAHSSKSLSLTPEGSLDREAAEAAAKVLEAVAGGAVAGLLTTELSLGIPDAVEYTVKQVSGLGIPAGALANPWLPVLATVVGTTMAARTFASEKTLGSSIAEGAFWAGAAGLALASVGGAPLLGAGGMQIIGCALAGAGLGGLVAKGAEEFLGDGGAQGVALGVSTQTALCGAVGVGSAVNLGANGTAYVADKLMFGSEVSLMFGSGVSALSSIREICKNLFTKFVGL